MRWTKESNSCGSIQAGVGIFVIAALARSGLDLVRANAIKVILVNVHGGGMTVCDTVAEGINFAYMRSDRKIPIVFRAAGQNADWARTIMKDRRLPFERVDGMAEAAARAVAIARGKG